MQAKPDYYGTYYAEAFQNNQVVDAYHFRPPYPAEVFEILASLITDEPRALLDVGTGSGDVARQCIDFVERIDAVDFSQNMIENGKRLPNGNHPHLNWIYGKIEEVPLNLPYALITAGSSIHWTEWSIAFPRFRDMLTPHGYLALPQRQTLPMPWEEELKHIRARYSTRQDRGGAHVLEELEPRGFFRRQGQKKTTPIPFVQSISDYIEGLHSRSGFARARMGEPQATQFDQEVRALVLQHHPDGMIPFQVVATVTWGFPEAGK
jgi:SAM-dependent methyltransferase